MLAFMKPYIEILFKEHKTAKEMFDAIFSKYPSSSETYI